jgi:hypothetical protein
MQCKMSADIAADRARPEHDDPLTHLLFPPAFF